MIKIQKNNRILALRIILSHWFFGTDIILLGLIIPKASLVTVTKVD